MTVKKAAAGIRINSESCTICKGCLDGSILGEAIVNFLITVYQCTCLRVVRQGSFLQSLAKLKADLGR